MQHLYNNSSSKLNQIKDALADFDNSTKNFVCTLENFNSQLKSIQDLFSSIYDCDSLSQFDCNSYSDVVLATDRILKHYQVVKDINKYDINEVGSDIDDVIKKLDDVNEAKKFFAFNRPQSIEFTTSTIQFDSLIKKLEMDFTTVLNEQFNICPSLFEAKMNSVSNQSTPLTTRSVITPARKIDPPERPNLANYYTKLMTYIDKIRRMYFWINENLISNINYFIDILISSRTDFLALAIKRSRGGFGTPSATLHANYSLHHKTFSPISRNSTKSSPLQAGHSLLQRTSKNQNENSDIYNIDSLIGLTYNLSILAETELDLLVGIFFKNFPQSNDYINTIFHSLIISHFDMIDIETQKAENSYISLNSSKYITSILTSLLNGLANITEIKLSFNKAFEEKHETLEPIKVFNERLTSLFAELQFTTGKTIDHQVDVVQKDPLHHSLMPTDGNVHEFVAKFVPFLSILFENRKVVGECLNIYFLRKDNVYFPLNCMELSLSSATLKVTDFIVKTFLPALESNLLQKATLYSDSAIRLVFLINNFTYILRNVSLFTFEHTTDRDKIIDRLLDDTKNKILRNIDKFESEYLLIWDMLFKPFERDVYKSNVELKDRERKIIKEMLHTFNKDMEETAKSHKNMFFADNQKRKDICKKCTSLVVKKYQQELQPYSRLPFSSNPSKYFKYDAHSLTNLIKNVYELT